MNYSLNMGDLLYRSKDFVEHAGVYLGNNLVFHISPHNGAETISFSEYSAGLPVKVVRTNLENKDLLEERLKNILCSSNSYKVASNNCEHIASYLIYGRKVSPQLQAGLCGAIIGMLFGKKMSTSAKALLAIVGAITGCLLSNSYRRYDTVIEPMNYD